MNRIFNELTADGKHAPLGVGGGAIGDFGVGGRVYTGPVCFCNIQILITCLPCDAFLPCEACPY